MGEMPVRCQPVKCQTLTERVKGETSLKETDIPPHLLEPTVELQRKTAIRNSSLLFLGDRWVT